MSLFNLIGKLTFWLQKNTPIVALLIVLINVLLRIFHTDESSIYLDEGQTMFQVKRDISLIITDYVMKQQNAPLYFILVHFWIKLFGLSVFGVRLFSVLMMALTAGVSYVFAKKTHSISFALAVSLLFLGVNDFMNFAHEARGYALIGFFSVTSFFALYMYLTEEKRHYLYLLVLCNIGLLYTHYLTIYVFPTQFLVTLFWFLSTKNRSIFSNYIFSQIIVALAFAPWLTVVFSVMPEKGEFWIPEPTWGILKNTFYYLVNGIVKTYWVFSILGLALILWISKVKAYSKKQNLLALMLVFWAFIPVFSNYFLGFKIPVFIAKYTFYASFGFLLLFTLAVFSLPVGHYLKWTFILFCAFLNFKSLNFNSPKSENWKSAVEYVKGLEKTEETIFFIQSSYTYKAFYVYYDLNFFKQTDYPFSEGEKDGIFFGDDVGRLKKVVDKQKPQKIVLIRSHWNGSDKNGLAKKYLDENAIQLSENKSFEKVEVYEYQLP